MTKKLGMFVGGALSIVALSLGHDAAAQDICYAGHVQNIGWQNNVCDGNMAGTIGKGLRMEAVKIFNPRFSGGQICYQAHSQNVGTGPVVCNGLQAGTTGQGLRMEALTIYYNSPPAGHSLLFRGQLANFGWQTIETSGQMLGQTGQSRSIESLEVNINTGQNSITWQ